MTTAVFDRAAFEAACMNDPGITRDVLAAFAESRVQLEAEVCAAVDAGDTEGVERTAHKLKSALGTLRAERGHLAAAALVEAARQQQPERFVETLAALRAELGQLDAALSALG